MLDRLAKDELMSNLAAALWPSSARSRGARERGAGKVRPYLHSHGGNVELLWIRDDGQ